MSQLQALAPLRSFLCLGQMEMEKKSGIFPRKELNNMLISKTVSQQLGVV